MNPTAITLIPHDGEPRPCNVGVGTRTATRLVSRRRAAVGRSEGCVIPTGTPTVGAMPW